MKMNMMFIFFLLFNFSLMVASQDNGGDQKRQKIQQVDNTASMQSCDKTEALEAINEALQTLEIPSDATPQVRQTFQEYALLLERMKSKIIFQN